MDEGLLSLMSQIKALSNVATVIMWLNIGLIVYVIIKLNSIKKLCNNIFKTNSFNTGMLYSIAKILKHEEDKEKKEDDG